MLSNLNWEEEEESAAPVRLESRRARLAGPHSDFWINYLLFIQIKVGWRALSQNVIVSDSIDFSKFKRAEKAFLIW